MECLQIVKKTASGLDAVFLFFEGVYTIESNTSMISKS